MVTLYRPSNVDSAAMMARIGGALKEIAGELPLIFPVHPRTRGNLEKFGIDLGPGLFACSSLPRRRQSTGIELDCRLRGNSLPRT